MTIWVIKLFVITIILLLILFLSPLFLEDYLNSQYIYTGCKMIIIKDKESRVTLIKFNDNYSYILHNHITHIL